MAQAFAGEAIMSRLGEARATNGPALAALALAGSMLGGSALAEERSDIHPGTNALTVKYQGVKPGVLLAWKDLPPETVRYLVRHGISVMPQFRKTEISDADLDALAKFLSRNTPTQ
jgi:mono/diheme cytochrome c family protein